MPKGGGNKIEIVLFKPSPWEDFMSEESLEKCFERRGFKPADPISVAAFNEANPAFADKIPHGTQWKDAEGNWCFITFGRFGGERMVVVGQNGGWVGPWWFAGVRK
jgi:hypothetical protein